jgi:DNA-binding PadR family transcriptional regulator
MVELERLESEGLLAVRVVEQRRRPTKRVFSLIDAGRDELHAFTTQPARPMAMRDDLVVKLQALDAGDPDAVMAALAERLEPRSSSSIAPYFQTSALQTAGGAVCKERERRGSNPLWAPH